MQVTDSGPSESCYVDTCLKSVKSRSLHICTRKINGVADSDSNLQNQKPAHVLTYMTEISSTVFWQITEYSFLCPGLKGPPGASSNRIVCLSVRPFVRLSVIQSRLQTKCNI